MRINKIFSRFRDFSASVKTDEVDTLPKKLRSTQRIAGFKQTLDRLMYPGCWITPRHRCKGIA